MDYPIPLERLRAFAKRVERCVVIEEGDPVLADALRAAGIQVEAKPEMYRFGELDVQRVRRILANDTSPEAALPRGKASNDGAGKSFDVRFGHRPKTKQALVKARAFVPPIFA